MDLSIISWRLMTGNSIMGASTSPVRKRGTTMTLSLDSMYASRSRPLVFGHRGASGHAPMNTLPAFELAAAQGADGVELDVWLCKSGEIVILHDSAVDGTTGGTGFVWDLTLDALKALDAGRWKGEQFARACIPTLDEVFAAVGQRLFINVEIKSDARMRQGIEAALAECIARHAMAERVFISSFDPLVLARFHEAARQVPIAFLEWEGTTPQAYQMADALPCAARHPHHTQVDAAYMTRARKAELRVNTWTVNEVDDALRLRDLGVDALMTDYPDLLLSALRAR